jgi:putative hydroxymethylpyrimidine transport system substrate-binding protein
MSPRTGSPAGRPRLRRRLLAAGLTLALAVAVAACGEKKESLGTPEPQSFDLALDFYVNPDHAGIFVALDNGYFQRAGLDVHPRVPSDPSAPIKEVAAGRVDLAVSYEPEVLLAQDQGLDVQAVAAVVASPLTSLISLPAGGIAKAADLNGKTVATAGIPYQSDYLETILGTAGLPPSAVKEENVGLNLLPALIGGKVDAILGGFRNIEGVDLSLRGLNPLVIPVDQLGVPTYDELVLVAKRSTVEDDPENLRLFIAALAHGTRDAIEDPQLATDAILKAGQGLDPAQTRAEVDATLPLLDSPAGEPYGRMDPAKWELFASWMKEHSLISDVPEASQLLTNELLPGPR